MSVPVEQMVNLDRKMPKRWTEEARQNWIKKFERCDWLSMMTNEKRVYSFRPVEHLGDYTYRVEFRPDKSGTGHRVVEMNLFELIERLCWDSSSKGTPADRQDIRIRATA